MATDPTMLGSIESHDIKPLMVRIDESAKNGLYLKLGMSVRLKDDERPTLDSYVIVCDREGLCSFHKVAMILRPQGVRTLLLGPQVEWPQGGLELRNIKDYQ